ncbi:major facilitator superfamily domain-containing protein 1-like [Aricia agestis]|uniref:major facilitator superfamily domain-containing protein 1-like n=1 Tax=Aricia agestis TaxID=91739 RepID=UPI001C20379F|nr:major facilitator superfamily domain-containing protein 1-like [Aricia agestis]XP_041985279.1 major facilitator superfamily domain-containing protein 1-like [Aricia agestis]
MDDLALPEDPRPTGEGSWCHPANKIHRFFALLLMCFLCFGSYFCYDTPGALGDHFKFDSGLNTSQFALLYSIYSWPNVVLCFIGGYLIDRCFGVRLGAIIYMSIVFIGAVVFALGVYINAFWLMIMGRFIFGIGGESLQVAVNNYVVLWFKGRELNMVFGLQLSFSRFGSTVNFWVMQPVYAWVGQYYGGYEKLGVTLFIASLTCLGSLICGLILGFMDHRAERILGRQEEQSNNEPFRLSDILHFKLVFWLLCVICVAYYVAIFPFIALAKVFFERKYDLSPQDANTVNSMVYFISAGLSPFFGILIDKTGRNVMWVTLSIITTVASHSLLAFTFINPYLGVVCLGISYSLLASGLWPLVAMIVPSHQLGTAYGICQAVQNLGLATVIILTGMIVDAYGYLMLEMFFVGCLFIALIAAVLIYIVDSANNGVLNMTIAEREALKPETTESNTEETANLLDNESSQDEGDSAPATHSDRIRSRYLAQILPDPNQ